MLILSQNQSAGMVDQQRRPSRGEDLSDSRIQPCPGPNMQDCPQFCAGMHFERGPTMDCVGHAAFYIKHDILALG